MRGLDHALSWLVYAAVISMTVFAVFANFAIIIQSVLSPLLVVQGSSMEPYIEEGDAVLLAYPGEGQLHVGDVVVFRDPLDPGVSIVHRIVELQEEEETLYAMTKGDANAIRDPIPIPVDSVGGKVRLVLPKAGLLITFLISPQGFALCVLCPLSILLLYLLATLNQGKEQPEESRSSTPCPAAFER